MAGIELDGVNQKVVLDSDGDTYLEAATDDTIKVYVAGAHDATISANAINVLSGTTLTIDSGATITNSGTANGFGSNEPSSADGQALGSASAEWSDLFLADGGIIKFGNDQDTLLTHTDGTGLTLNSTNKLCFNDATQFIQGASGTVLNIAATDEIDLTATAVDLNGTLDVSGTSLLTGRVGVVTAGDLGTGIHVRTADSGAGVSTNADELVVENSGTCGISILSGNSQNGVIHFGDDGDNDIGNIDYDHSDNSMKFVSNTTEALRLTGQKLSTRGEASPDVDGGGITLNQAADDARIFSLKNSDVAHGMTSEAETDTYGNFGKAIAAQGGLRINGYTEGTRGVKICGRAVAGNVFDGEATDTPCIVEIDGRQNDAGGTPANLIAVGADNNVFGVTNADDVQFIVKGDGEIFSNQSATVGTFDAYDDAQLVRANDLFHKKGVINSKFDKFVKYNKKDLMDARLLGRERDKDGNDSPTPFVNITGMQRLHNGAIWQQYEKHNQLLDAVYDLAKEAVGEKKANAILEKHEIKRLN